MSPKRRNMKQKKNAGRRKVLLIKLGYSETLVPEISNVISYGDVLRTTVLLNLYKDDRFTWLVDENSHPILENNGYIDRLLAYSTDTASRLKREHFDIVINLEKIPELCSLADKIKAKQHYGFRFNDKKGIFEAYKGTENALSLCHDKDRKKNRNKYWSEYLYEIVGEKWAGEEYVFGCGAEEKDIFDIGFNFKVGSKWPIKAWPLENWKELEKLLKKKFTVSWQEGLFNMEQYFEWINRCKLIVTNDSFGLHLALALKKKAVVIYGPTNPHETYLYTRAAALAPKNIRCAYYPCHSQICARKSGLCIYKIKPKDVYTEICKMLK